MRISAGSPLLVAAMLCLQPIANSADLTLAREGKALVAIVRPAQASPAESTAVQELADYLGKSTGATFAVVAETALPTDSSAIFVGPTAFAATHEIDSAKLAKEESVIRTVNGRLIIAGGRPRGTLYGVYRFLEDQLGVRWYNQWCEKVPSLPVCTIGELDLRHKPYLEYRDHYGSGLPAVTDNPPYNTGDFYRWIARNRLNGHGMGGGLWYKDKYSESPTGRELGGGLTPGGYPNHTFWYFFPPDEYFNKHPEYYSMRKGRRVYDPPARYSTSGNHLCLTNPEVRKLMLEKVLALYRKIPSADFVSISQNDGGESTFCDCPACRAFVDQHGNEADLFYDFVNPIADAVAKEFPGKLIFTLGGYQPVVDPPLNIKPRDNVIVVNPVYRNVARHIWIWDHAFSGAFTNMRYLKPTWWELGRRLREWKQQGVPVTGMLEEDEVSYTDPLLSEMYEIHPWLVAKLGEDPERDVTELVRDYVCGVYGAAGPYLAKYFELQAERASRWPWRFIDYDYVRESQELFDQAEVAVEGNAELLTRVRDLRINADFTALAWRQQAIADYLRRGNRLADYPYRKELLGARLLKTLAATKHPYWQQPGRYCYGKGANAKETMRDLAPLAVQKLLTGPEFVSLPAELPEAVRKLPPDRLIDIPLSVFNKVEVTPDPDAVQGAAYSFSWKQFPFETAAYRNFTGENPREGYASTPRLIGSADVKGDGYHLYRGGRFLLDNTPGWSLLYLCYSWEYQISLDSLKPTGAEPHVWEWYVSLKFLRGADGRYTGEARADRVILADLGEAKTLTAAGKTVPTRNLRLVARWKFDGTGENRAGDTEKWRLPDARIDAPQYTDGRFGQALALTKPANIGVVPFDKRTMLLNDTGFTLTLRFRADSATPGQTLVEQYADGMHYFSLSLAGKNRLELETVNTADGKPVRLLLKPAKGNVADGHWHRLTVGYDRERHRLFGTLDGKVATPVALAEFPAIPEVIWLGGGRTGFLHGAFDEVQLYRSVLEDAKDEEK